MVAAKKSDKNNEVSNDFNFEEALTKLENIVGKLENGKLPLDESLKLYEEGVKLGRLCHEKLRNVEEKIEILTHENDDGYEVEPFETNDEDASEE